MAIEEAENGPTWAATFYKGRGYAILSIFKKSRSGYDGVMNTVTYMRIWRKTAPSLSLSLSHSLSLSLSHSLSLSLSSLSYKGMRGVVLGTRVGKVWAICERMRV